MALLKLKEKGGMAVSPEKAATIWRIMQGEITGTPKQNLLASLTADVMMDWKHPACPESYLIAKRATIAPEAIEMGVTVSVLPETEFWTSNDQYGDK